MTKSVKSLAKRERMLRAHQFYDCSHFEQPHPYLPIKLHNINLAKTHYDKKIIINKQRREVINLMTSSCIHGIDYDTSGGLF